MSTNPNTLTLIPRTPRNQNALIPDDRTFNNDYDPIVAQNDESTGVTYIGTPGSNCYGLRAEPFNECSNFLAILEYDNRISSFYNLIYQNITGENLSPDFIVGITKSIFTQALQIPYHGISFIDSIMSTVSSAPYWTDANGNKIGVSDDAYNDTSIDRTGWFLTAEPTSTIDKIIFDKYKEALEILQRSISNFAAFDATGASYPGGCVEYNGTPFTLHLSSGGIVSVPWVTAVAKYGPDAIRRGEYRGSYVKVLGQDIPVDLIEEATFYNMCTQARECIKEYRDNYPSSYESDLASLTDEQIETLNSFPDFENQSSINSRNQLRLALTSIETAIQFLLDPLYYEQPSRVVETNNNRVSAGLSTSADLVSTYVVNDDGMLDEEQLYRLAISSLAIKNVISILLESLSGAEVAEIVSDYNDYVDDLRNQIQDEYDKRVADEEARRIEREAANAERFFVCRDPKPMIEEPCADKPSPTKSFFLDWTKKDRSSPYYAPDLKKYFLVYDVVMNNFSDFQTKIESYKLEVMNLLDNVYNFNLFDNATVSLETKTLKANTIVKLEQDGVYYEPRAFKPSKLLYSISEEDLNAEAKSLVINPRFTNVSPVGKYIKSYSMTIKDFFDSLTALEEVMKKYVFDYALWKVTFGDVNPGITSMSVSTNKIFKNLKTDILKQDSKNFQKFRPLFGSLFSRNGIGLIEEIKLKRQGQFSIDDRINLVFSFELPNGTSSPGTVQGTNVLTPTESNTTHVNPPANNSETRPPTYNNSSGLATGFTSGVNTRLYRIQLTNGSRAPLDLVWKNQDGSGDPLDGLNYSSPCDNNTAMNYLMNMDMILPLVRPNKNDR